MLLINIADQFNRFHWHAFHWSCLLAEVIIANSRTHPHFNLMRKLEIHNNAQLVQYAIQKKIIKIQASL